MRATVGVRDGLMILPIASSTISTCPSGSVRRSDRNVKPCSFHEIGARIDALPYKPAGSRIYASVVPRLTTKELSKATFGDFERLFAPGQGWSTCGCLAYQGFRPPPTAGPLVRRDWVLERKRELVEAGRAHGILVYAGDEPVGWCQYGPSTELPLRRGGAMAQVFPRHDETVWRITCFVTHKEHRGVGVSRTALRGALRAIRSKGGGTVEAYPVVVVRTDPARDPRRARAEAWGRELNRILTIHGGRSEEAERHLAKRVRVTEHVEGLGRLDATYWQGFHGGTVPLFEAEGFRAVSVIPSRARLAAEPTSRPARVLMRTALWRGWKPLRLTTT